MVGKFWWFLKKKMTGVAPGRKPSQSWRISSWEEARLIWPSLEAGNLARFLHLVMNSFPVRLMTTN